VWFGVRIPVRRFRREYEVGSGSGACYWAGQGPRRLMVSVSNSYVPRKAIAGRAAAPTRSCPKPWLRP
jgi:hypothetical protein